jgi:hypothetical protein
VAVTQGFVNGEESRFEFHFEGIGQGQQQRDWIDRHDTKCLQVAVMSADGNVLAWLAIWREWIGGEDYRAPRPMVTTVPGRASHRRRQASSGRDCTGALKGMQVGA